MRHATCDRCGVPIRPGQSIGALELRAFADDPRIVSRYDLCQACWKVVADLFGCQEEAAFTIAGRVLCADHAPEVDPDESHAVPWLAPGPRPRCSWVAA